MLAFIGTSELILAAFVGLLLFGGRLPEVMREVGKVWFGLRRSLNDIKRESGFDEAVRDIRRETEEISRETKDFRVSPYDWKQDLDPFAGPGKEEPVSEAKAEPADEEDQTPGESAPPQPKIDRKTPPHAVSREDAPPKPDTPTDGGSGSAPKAEEEPPKD
jgi:Sec-independent protein translocase protein TatA